MIIVVSLPLATSLIILQYYTCIKYYTQILDDVTVMIKHGTMDTWHDKNSYAMHHIPPFLAVWWESLSGGLRSRRGYCFVSEVCRRNIWTLSELWRVQFRTRIWYWLIFPIGDRNRTSIWLKCICFRPILSLSLRTARSIQYQWVDARLDPGLLLCKILFDDCSRNPLRFPLRKYLTNTDCPTSILTKLAVDILW